MQWPEVGAAVGLVACTWIRSRWCWPSWVSPASLEVVVGLALAKRLELHALAVEPGRPRGAGVGLERWSTGRGNVASLGGLVVGVVVGVGLVVLEHAQARAPGLGAGEVVASLERLGELHPRASGRPRSSWWSWASSTGEPRPPRGARHGRPGACSR